MKTSTALPAMLLVAALAGCSGSGNDHAANAQPATEVSAELPTRQTFHTRVAAFGQLAADSRNALSLSLPHATQIVATEVLAGQRVKRGAVLLRLATNPATRSAYLQAKSALRAAHDGVTQTQRLHAEKLATNAQLDAARKTLADAQAAFDAQARLGGAQAVTALKAPADGVVTALNVQRGQRIAADTKLIEFAPRAALAAQLGVEPDAAAGIHASMPVEIHPVYASRGTRPFGGTVAMVADAVNPQTHLVDVVATLNASTTLPAGTALSATIDTTAFTAWAVPRNALQSDAQGSYVYQIEDGNAHRVDVRVVAPDGNPIGVDGAINVRTPVITLGSNEVSDGDPVRATPGTDASRAGATAR